VLPPVKHLLFVVQDFFFGRRKQIGPLLSSLFFANSMKPFETTNVCVDDMTGRWWNVPQAAASCPPGTTVLPAAGYAVGLYRPGARNLYNDDIFGDNFSVDGSVEHATLDCAAMSSDILSTSFLLGDSARARGNSQVQCECTWEPLGREGGHRRHGRRRHGDECVFDDLSLCLQACDEPLNRKKDGRKASKEKCKKLCGSQCPTQTLQSCVSQCPCKGNLEDKGGITGCAGRIGPDGHSTVTPADAAQFAKCSDDCTKYTGGGALGQVAGGGLDGAGESGGGGGGGAYEAAVGCFPLGGYVCRAENYQRAPLKDAQQPQQYQWQCLGFEASNQSQRDLLKLLPKHCENVMKIAVGDEGKTWTCSPQGFANRSDRF
jgi:hypothetical protein